MEKKPFESKQQNDLNIKAGNSTNQPNTNVATSNSSGKTPVAKSKSQASAVVNVFKSVLRFLKSHFEWTTGILALTIAAGGLNYAAKTYEASVDTSHRQLRAYIGLDKLLLELPSIGPNYKPYVLKPGLLTPDKFILQIKNTGTTPAKHVRPYINWQPMPYGQSLPIDFPFADNKEKTDGYHVVRSNPNIFPGQTYSYPVKLEDITEFILSTKGANHLYFYGHIDYEDIYDITHRTTFCYTYQPGAPPDLQILPYDRYNDAD